MVWFTCATHRPIHTNTGGHLSPNLGLILHHAVANGSLYTFFNTSSAQVSAHFWVSKNGTIEQYVDTDMVAWHGMDLNSRYVGVETEGCVSPPHAEPMTEAMIDALAQLYAEGMSKHGWKAQLANKNGDSGFGYHRMAVATACPCDVRLNMRQEILNRATGNIITTTPPVSTAKAPSFPYPPDHYLGQPSPDTRCHSGFYGGVDTSNVHTWQARMFNRGWTIDVDGKYGPQSEEVCRQFQSEKGLSVDGLVGPQTWKVSWEAPVT